jgi:hypothetical protein
VPPPSNTTRVRPSHPKIDPVTRTAVDLHRGCALPDRREVGGVAVREPGERDRDNGGRSAVEAAEHSANGLRQSIEVFDDLDQIFNKARRCVC